MTRSKAHNRCCNPFKRKNHNARKNLRKATDAQMKKWKLTINSYLSVNCRMNRKNELIDVEDNPLNVGENAEVNLQGTQNSQASLGSNSADTVDSTSLAGNLMSTYIYDLLFDLNY